VQQYGSQPSSYLNTVLQQKADDFIRYAATKRNPFLLEVASFSPHHPYVPAPRDLGTYHGSIPHGPSFNKLGSPAPAWMLSRHPLGPDMLRKVQRWWELRVEAVQSVDRMITRLEQTVQQIGQAQNTVFVFSSDNGYHMAQHTLAAGKQTAFDTDIRVPLVVAGPGIPAGSTNTDMAENIDLRPTFEQLADAPTPADVNGHSLVPLLHGEPVPWRKYALVEHDHPAPSTGDPDAQGYLGGDPPTYTAIRSRRFIYVRYDTGDREYYNLIKDPAEMHDIGPALPPKRIAALDAIMDRLAACRGGEQCWQAGVPGRT
jgi:arylsulfatase A-like enzyme